MRITILKRGVLDRHLHLGDVGAGREEESVKDSDNVLVHPQWGTVHEVYGDGTTIRWGQHPKTNYRPMTRSQANAAAGSKICLSRACKAARRDN